MDFNSIGIVLMTLVSLAIFMGIIIPKFSPENTNEETPQTIVDAALNGETRTLIFSPSMTYDICSQFDARYGCYENQIGVEGGCELEAHRSYKIHAYPYGTGVCLNISILGSE